MVESYTYTPIYDLAEVKLLVEQDRVRWRGPRCQMRCLQELGFSTDRVHEEISYLRENDYKKTFHYDDDPTPDDAYRLLTNDIRGVRVRAFIKLRIDNLGGIALDIVNEVNIGSFHR